MVAYAGLNPSHHRSGTSIDRPTRISKIGNATLRLSLNMPALSAMGFNPAVKALVARLKSAGRLKPKQMWRPCGSSWSSASASRQASGSSPLSPCRSQPESNRCSIANRLFRLSGGRSRGQGGPQARAQLARLVLDRSERADMLNQISRIDVCIYLLRARHHIAASWFGE
jgi:hypothetical protein